MKKILINIEECEKIAIGKRGDFLVKCKRTNELNDVIKDEKDCKFLSVSMDEINLNELLQDDEHIYVNILTDKEKFGSHTGRVMVPDSNIDQLYAVQVSLEK